MQQQQKAIGAVMGGTKMSTYHICVCCFAVSTSCLLWRFGRTAVSVQRLCP